MPQIARTSSHRSKPPSEHSSAHPEHSSLNISHLRSSRSHSSPPVGPKSPAGHFSVSATVSQREVRSL